MAAAVERQWLATTAGQNGQIAGSIAIDGEDVGDGQVHPRWFILDDDCRGQGLGSALVHSAIEFVDRGQFICTVLWTPTPAATKARMLTPERASCTILCTNPA